MITSFRNPLVKRIKRLRQKKYRQQEGAFWVEGIRPVLTALEQGADLDTLVVAPDLLTSPAGQAAVAQQQQHGETVAVVSADLFASVSDRDRPVGLGAIIRRTLSPLENIPIQPNSLSVALCEISDPGNLGTIMRTVDAAGAQAVILVGDTVDPFHPQAVKASMGALFTVPVAVCDDITDLLAWAKSAKLFTIATSAHAPIDYRMAAYRFPALLLMGSEGDGLDADTITAADCAVSIPMQGASSSLNLAVATGILLYQITTFDR